MTATRPPLVIRLRVDDDVVPAAPVYSGARCARCWEPNPRRYGTDGSPLCGGCREGSKSTLGRSTAATERKAA